MNFIKNIFSVGLLFLIFSCSQEKKQEKIDYQALVNETCKCLTPMVDFHNASRMAMNQKDTVKLNELYESFPEIQLTTSKCAKEMDAKLAELSPEERRICEDLLVNTCREVAILMSESQQQ